MKEDAPFLNLNLLGSTLPSTCLPAADLLRCLWPRFPEESGRDGAQGKATQEGETENREGKARRVPLSLADMPPGLSAHRCFSAHPNG
jgi:hypothetical protein